MSDASPFLPYNLPSIDEQEIAEVTAVLRSGWLTTGPVTQRFEAELAEYVGAPHALAVNSCTAGLHLALQASGVGPGDEVITTPMTFCATVNTILHTGAKPVLADIGDDFNIDPAQIERKITPLTRAIVPVHMAGLACDMDAIWAIAQKHGLLVIEDAAHAIGTQYKQRPIGYSLSGSRSTAVAFSFYATKNLTTGEGGMVTTHDPQLMEKMRILCLHGISRDAWKRYSQSGSWFYEVVEAGYKYNLSDLQSAIGIHQLRKQETFIRRRTEIAERYNEAFGSMPELRVPPQSEDCRHCWHLYMLRLALGRLSISRAEFIERMKTLGIGCSVHFIPIPCHPYFAASAAEERNHCLRSMELYETTVSLPLYPGMSDVDVTRVIEAVKNVIQDATVSIVSTTA